MFKRKLTNPVKLPHRQPTEHERFMAFLRHEESQKARQGYETLDESMDFDLPGDDDPLEHYFSQPTQHERIAELTDDPEKWKQISEPLPESSPQGVQPPSAAVGSEQSELGQ